MEQGRVWPKLKMVSQNHIKHKPVRNNASSMIQNGKAFQCEKPKMRIMRRLRMVIHQECWPPQPPSPSISRTGRDTTTSRLLAIWKSLIPTLQVRHLSQRGTTRPWHRYFWHIEMEPRPWSGFATPFRGKRLRQTHGRLLLNLPQRPVNMAIQASLTRRNHIPEAVMKRELQSPDLMTLLETELNTCAKISAEFQVFLETALSRMSWKWEAIHVLLTHV